MEDLTGVVLLEHDMCIDSCMAFTGPHSALDNCLICGGDCYLVTSDGKRHSRKEMTTIPLGPQLQAAHCSAESATALCYRHQKVAEILEQNQTLTNPVDTVFDDIFCGSNYLELYSKLELTEHDTVISFSSDSAQLYQNTSSDTWIGVWVVYDYDPEVPGPNKPKIIDSFTHPGFHHLAALQKENGCLGFKCWDGLDRCKVLSCLILYLNTADAIPLIKLDGRVGHHGAQGCRLGCSMKGRPKPGKGFYYSVHLKPNNYTIAGCNHPDIDFESVLELSSVAEYLEKVKRVMDAHT